jgi:hypothetical protein
VSASIDRIEHSAISSNIGLFLDVERYRYFSGGSNPVRPIGNPEFAKIGIVIDHASVNTDESSNGVPASLAALGLHYDNSLIWTYNHTQLGLFSADSPGTPSQEECDDYTEFLIKRTTLKVILLCGELAEKSVMSRFQGTQGMSMPYTMQLRGQTITMWLQSDGNSKKPNPIRVFIRTPEVFGLGILRRLDQIHIVGEIFGFVSFVTSIPLRCHFFEASAVYSRIFVQYRREKDDPKTEDDLD